MLEYLKPGSETKGKRTDMTFPREFGFKGTENGGGIRASHALPKRERLAAIPRPRSLQPHSP